VTDTPRTAKPNPWDILARADVLSGLLFIAVAAFGLWISRNYPVGTALRMGTGYVPRLLCWMLLGLGVIILVQGLRQPAPAPALRSTAIAWRAVLSVTIAIVAFALSLERLGLVLAIVLLTGIGALATRMLRPLETAIAAVALIVLSWGIFIAGLGLAIPVWPEW
jgi:hypothetical protein